MGNSVLKSPCQGFYKVSINYILEIKFLRPQEKLQETPPVLGIGSLVEVCLLIFKGHLEV